MSDSARYTCSSNYSDGSTSNRSESSTEEADDTNIPTGSPPQKVRIRGNRKTSPTPSLATSSDYVDYVDKTNESAEATLSTKATPEATLAPSPATATPPQPAPTHKSCRPTHNTPAINDGTTYKANSSGRSPTTLDKRPTVSKVATKITRKNLNEVRAHHDKLHRIQQRYEQTVETTPSKLHKGNNSESDKEVADDTNLLKEDGTEGPLSTRTPPVATLVPSPATATSPQPLPIYKSSRFTQNTPTTNVVSAHKTNSTGRPPTTRDKGPIASRDATRMTRRQLDEVHTLCSLSLCVAPGCYV